MTKLKYLLLFLICTNEVKSQTKEIIFIDSINKSAVQDVYIQTNINNKISIIGFSDNNGIIRLNIKYDTFKLTLSHISYYKKEFSLNNLKPYGIDTVYLIPITYVFLNILIENPKTHKTKTFGHYKNGKKQNLYAPSNRSIFGTKIKIDSSITKYKIQSLYCDFDKLNLVQNRKSDCEVGVIFHFLKFSSNSPTLEEVIDPIIIDYQNIKQNFKLEIPNSSIIDNSTGAIFIGIELQGIKCTEESVNYKNYYIVNQASPENLNWTYQQKQNSWKQYDNSLFSGKLGVSLKIAYHE
jgi:hypothetical protein